MKNKCKIFAFSVCALLLMVFMTGCGNDDPEEFVTEQMGLAISGDEQVVQLILSQELDALKGDYVLEFPESLKNPYCSFLKDACKNLQYEIVSCEKHNKGYKVEIELIPVDIADTLEEQNKEFVQNLQTTDLSEAVEELLDENAKLLAEAERGRKELVTLYLKKGDDGLEFDEGEWEDCVHVMLKDPLASYESVVDVLNSRDYLIATLDAIYNGDVARYAKHMGQTEEAALAVYKESFEGIDLSEMEMTKEQKDRFIDSMKMMFANSKYEVGAAKKTEEGYLIDVTVTPNLSLRNSGAAFNKNVRNGRYGTQEQVKEGYLQIMEEYAQTPVYDDTVQVEFHMPLGNLLYPANGETGFNELGEIIMPSVE